MSSAHKTDAIVVWDIENTRVPTQLIPRCFDIVQWLLQDIQERNPNSTVLRVYVAGTFDKYPTQLKKALCTHPRVQLLYSIGKIAKGGEADDALKRVMLEFHTAQIIASKQALIVLLSGDADYNDVVDTARIAGHKVDLYHSRSVAHTLQGNVDHHEPWQSFLARKSGQEPGDLEDTGYVARTASPLHMASGSVSFQQRVPHSHPGLAPVTVRHNARNRNRCLPQQHSQTGQTESADIDSAQNSEPCLPAKAGITDPMAKLTLSNGGFAQPEVISGASTPSAVMGCATEEAAISAHTQLPRLSSPEQPSQAPQDSEDSEPPQQARMSRRRQVKQLLPLPLPQQSVTPARRRGSRSGNAADPPGASSSTVSSPEAFTKPASDGRTVVVSGLSKGMAGPAARYQLRELPPVRPLTLRMAA